MPGHTVFFLLRVGCVGIGFGEVTLSRIIGYASFVEITANASLDLQFRVFGVVRGGDLTTYCGSGFYLFHLPDSVSLAEEAL